MIKRAYAAGAHAALMKFALDDTRSTPYGISYQQPSTTSEGRGSMIDQAFATNAALGQPDGELTSATNNILQPGGPPLPSSAMPRNFVRQTDQMGAAL
jgi:hypothetical protein